MTVEGMTIVVTGAASGIGYATMGVLEAGGATVIPLDRKPVDRPGYVQCDLASSASIGEACSRLPDRIDALCNIAGVPGTAPAEVVVAINVLGARQLTETLLPHIAPGGSVVNVASTAAADWPMHLTPVDELLANTDMATALEWYRGAAEQLPPAYNFSKAALIAYSVRLAWSCRERPVRVNAVCPGPVETPILPDFRASMGAALVDGVSALTGRPAQPEEIAHVVAFLAGSASSWVNGHALVVDGGLSGAVMSGALDLAALAS